MCTPGAENKIFRRNLQGKSVSAPPGTARVNFVGHFLLGGGDLEGQSGSFSSFRICFDGMD